MKESENETKDGLEDVERVFCNFEALEFGPVAANGYKGRVTSIFVSVNLNSTEGTEIPSCIIWRWY